MQRNVAGIERVASLLLGGLSLSQTLNSNRSVATKAAAGSVGLALLWRGATGTCPVYKSLDFTTYTPSNQTTAPQLLERSALVNLPIDEARSFLEMEDTPYGLFDSGRSEDEFQIDLGDRTWFLNLSPHADKERTLIKLSWKEKDLDSTLDSSEAMDASEASRGSQNFVEKLKNRATKPSPMIEIRKLKSLMETGEIATVEGQSHGERSALGTVLENFGEFILEKIQSRTALPMRPDSTSTSNSFNPTETDLYPSRKAHA